PADFTVDGVGYPTAEHYMMAAKARLFHDAGAEERIIAAGHPRDAKVIGREVRGFDQEAWEAARFGIVVDGSVAKFGQNEDLREFLLGTGNRVLVEASPRDRVWGIGLGARNDHATVPERWRGLNLLGFALMEARARLASAG
uniref:NADAR family protein n=1 Tax=Nocardiopsis halotolerans TaxID=124252 RepID=UPI00037CC52A